MRREIVNLDGKKVPVEYEDEEYIDLLIEAHITERMQAEYDGAQEMIYRPCVHWDDDINKKSPKRKSFVCRYCQTLFSSKARINRHRHNGCPEHLDDNGNRIILKLYPTLPSGGAKEVQSMAARRAKRVGDHVGKNENRVAIATSFEGSEEEEGLEHVNSNSHKKTDESEPSKKKSKTMNRASVRDAIVVGSDLKENQGGETKGEGGKNVQVSELNTKPQVTHAVEPLHFVEAAIHTNRVKSREEVIEEAKVVAATLTPQWSRQHTDPPSVKCPGLWHLMLAGILDWEWDKQLLPKFFNQLTSFINSGQLKQRLAVASGTWFMNCNADPSDEDRRAVQLCLERIKGDKVKGKENLGHEVHDLRRYMEYCNRKKDYEVELKAWNAEKVELAEFYVQTMVEDWETEERDRAERLQWGWNPLYVVLKKVKFNGLPTNPWVHNEGEAHDIIKVLQHHGSDLPYTPLIMKLVKIALHQSDEGRERNMCDTDCWLENDLLENLFSTKSGDTKRLLNAIRSFLTEGMFCFANMPYMREAARSIQDVIKDMRGGGSAKDVVLKEISKWISHIQLRAVEDMARINSDAFKLLWCSQDELEAAPTMCIFKKLLKCRECIDVGWLPIVPSHVTDFEDSSIMGASIDGTDYEEPGVAGAYMDATAALSVLYEQRLEANNRKFARPHHGVTLSSPSSEKGVQYNVASEHVSEFDQSGSAHAALEIDLTVTGTQKVPHNKPAAPNTRTLTEVGAHQSDSQRVTPVAVVEPCLQVKRRIQGLVDPAFLYTRRHRRQPSVKT